MSGNSVQTYRSTVSRSTDKAVKGANQAEKTIKSALMEKNLRAVNYFFEHFIPAFYLTLDEM